MPDIPGGLSAALADRYTIERELGRGGNAVVYLAGDRKHPRQVAIKVLLPELAQSVRAERFLREIEIAAKLTHPHILPLHDSGQADGFLYYVMPYVAGESLRDRLKRDKQLPLEDALQIAREVAAALSYAHRQEVVHRDIKPENILLSDGHAVVADFGIARALTEASGQTVTQTGIAVGTPIYMSPEQGGGSKTLDGRSDVYSLGCVLYEMLAGRPPFTGETPQEILAHHALDPVPALRKLRADAPQDLDRVIRHALAKAPADRFATAAAFAAALAVTDGRAAWRPLPQAAVVVAISAVAAIGIWLVGRHGEPRAVDERRLAIFPFRAPDARARVWTETLADFLSTALDGTPDVRIADPWALWRSLRPSREAQAQSPDPVEAARLALRARAGRFVLGTVAEAGGRIDLSLRIYRTGVPEPLASFAASGSPDSLASLVQRMAVGIITRVWDRGSQPSVPPIESYATRSSDALKAYLAAKEAMRRGLVDSAATAIDHAIALDSNFSLALVEAITIKSWANFMTGRPHTGIAELAARAVRTGESLSERNRLTARAALAAINTDGAAVVEALTRIIELDSTDLGAWQLLGYSHLVYGWQYGVDARGAWQAYERVRLLDSTYVPGLVNRAYVSTIFDDSNEVRRQMGTLARADTAVSLVRGAWWGLRALLAGDAEFAALADTVANGSPAEWIAVLRYLRVHRPVRAEVLLGRVRQRAAPGFPTRAALGAQVQLAIAEGRLRQVDSAIRSGTFADFPGLDQQFELVLLAAALAGVAESLVVQRAVASLTAYVPIDSAVAYFKSRPVASIGWALGAYHARMGDTAVARRWWAAMGGFPADQEQPQYTTALQADLGARLAERRGDLAGALVLAQRAYRAWRYHENLGLDASPEAAARFNLAHLLRISTAPERAKPLLRSLCAPTTWTAPYTARSEFELAELAESERDFPAAARAYATALALWQRGGPEIGAWRARAAAGLRRSLEEHGR